MHELTKKVKQCLNQWGQGWLEEMADDLIREWLEEKLAELELEIGYRLHNPGEGIKKSIKQILGISKKEKTLKKTLKEKFAEYIDRNCRFSQSVAHVDLAKIAEEHFKK